MRQKKGKKAIRRRRKYLKKYNKNNFLTKIKMEKLRKFFEKIFMPARQVFQEGTPDVKLEEGGVKEAAKEKPPKLDISNRDVRLDIYKKVDKKIAKLEDEGGKEARIKRLDDLVTLARKREAQFLAAKGKIAAPTELARDLHKIVGGEAVKKTAAQKEEADAKAAELAAELGKLDIGTIGAMGEGVKVEGVEGEGAPDIAPQKSEEPGLIPKVSAKEKEEAEIAIAELQKKRKEEGGLAAVGDTTAAAGEAPKVQKVEGPTPGPAPEAPEGVTVEKYVKVNVPKTLKRQARDDLDKDPGLTEKKYQIKEKVKVVEKGEEKEVERTATYIAKFVGEPNKPKMIKWRKELA